MKSLNKIISGYMYRITFLLVAVILVFLLCVQLYTEQNRSVDDSQRTLLQIEQVLNENQKELEKIQAEYRQTCLHNAETVARIIESDPDVLDDIDELKEIAVSLEIDEIHIFDDTGRIFAGTHPQYYDFTFDSGEQMMFFKPMLEDKTLRLVQDITPNTAEAKPMQYSAIWAESGEIIVQIGMEPVNVTKVTEKNELSHIFSMFRINPDANYYAIDSKTHEIIGSTDLATVGCKAADIGFDMQKIENDPDGFHNTVSGTLSFCIFTKTGNTYIGRIAPVGYIYRRVPMTVFWIALSLFTVAFVLAKAVVRHINKYVINDIYSINGKLLKITAGNFKIRIEEKNSTELTELGKHINAMVKSLLENSNRMSYVLSKTNLHIGTYEYSEKSGSVQYTEHIPAVFNVSDDVLMTISSDVNKFKVFIESVKQSAVSNENNVYRIGGNYIHIEEEHSDGDVFGVAIDVTEEIAKRKEVERERDIDTLTGLYNRKGLDVRLSKLFAAPEKIKHSAVVMIDADGLKGINDTYGHEKGDIYLKSIADAIGSFGSRKRIAARQGGDEYVLFLYGYDSEMELTEDIEKLRLVQEGSTADLDREIIVPLRFSFGCCIVNGEQDIQKLFKDADEKMYQNKVERKKHLISQ